MSRFKTGHTFRFNEQVTPQKLNDAVNKAEFGDGVVDGNTIEVDIEGALAVKQGGIGNDQLADQSVTTSKIKDEAISEAKLAGQSVSNSKLQANSVGTGQIQDQSITQEKLSPSVQLIPPGMVMAFANDTNIPDGWLVCDGSEYDSEDFMDLFLTIGTVWGGGGGTFRVPDYRGVALRGYDQGRGLDPDRLFAKYQEDEFKRHRHDYQVHKREGGKSGSHDPTNAEKLYETRYTGYEGGSETRMKNQTVVWLIKT